MRGGEAELACVVCGAAVNPRTADITEVGMRCAPCGLVAGAVESRQALERRDEADRDRLLSMRAARSGMVHAVVWGGATAFFARGVAMSGRGWSLLPVGLVMGLAWALSRRRRWAYLTAVTLDLAAAAGFVTLSAIKMGLTGLPGSLFATAVPLAAGALLWSTRAAFTTTPPQLAAPVRPASLPPSKP